MLLSGDRGYDGLPGIAGLPADPGKWYTMYKSKTVLLCFCIVCVLILLNSYFLLVLNQLQLWCLSV